MNRLFPFPSQGVGILLLAATVLGARGATFTWTQIAAGNPSGSWTNQASWLGATLPTTSTDTANFNTLDLTADSTVTLDGNQTVNVLNFGDANSSTPASWIINAGAPSASTLTLAGGSPTINVTSLGSGKAAVINAAVAGTGGLTKSGTSFLQLNAANGYSGTTILSGGDCRISVGNANAFGTGTVQVGANAGDGQVWFNAAGAQTVTNAFEIRTVRWIIDSTTVNGVAAGDLTVNGNVRLNNGTSNVRDIYPNGVNLVINGQVAAASSLNPLNKNGGSTLTLNGSNFVQAASAVNAGTLAINGPLNGGATLTVNSGGTLTGTGVFSGTISVASGGTLAVGSYGSGKTTCGGLTSVSGATFNFNLGATNAAANGFLKVNGSAVLSGTVNIADAGGFNSGVYTGLQYSGSITLNGLAAGTVPGGKTVWFDTNTPGFVLFRVLNGTLNPTAGQNLPMDLTSPLAFGWLEVPGATAYDLFLGTASNVVASATTNTGGVYQGRTAALTMNLTGLLPNTTYYWRADGVAANGTPTKGTVCHFTTGVAMVDLMEDTWVATDALNRSLPGLADCGAPRTNKPIGLFYYLWHHGYGYGSGTNWDVSQYLARHPYTNAHNPWADSPIMQTANATYWWGQPALGYYDPSDPWMLRRQVALLSHAGIDVLIFDYSNAVTYDTQLDALCDTIRQMRFEGYSLNFKIVFLTHANSGTTATYLYNNFYGPGKYADLWYYWQGKPLILGYVNGSGGGDSAPSTTVKSFFTWRTSWANYTTSLQDEWSWVDTPSPPHWNYDARADLPEQVPVSCGGWANGNLGKSNSNGQQQDYDGYHLPLQRTSNLGIFFQEQMHYGLKYDPQFLFLTQWNEWIAGAFAAPTYCYTHLLADCCPVGGFYFVDEYNEEYSRDLEPMQGGHTDNYYFQMVGQNRLRKGVRPIPPASAPQSINLAGGFAQWNAVAPSYFDPANDTIYRNFASSVSQVGTYTNYTGRNDFTLLKVARDANNFYFFAQCHSNLTPRTGSNWMVLFLDADQNHATGWEGYDYAVNLGGVGPATTTLFQNTTTSNAWNWTAVRNDIAYTASGNQLMLAVPRAALGLLREPVSFDFHWADNFQTNDIADFGVDGDSAPDRRFNYRYVTTTNTLVTLLADGFESGQQPVWAETWTNGSQWRLTRANPYAGTYCAVCTNGTGQSNLIARVSTAGYGSLRLNFHYKLHNVKDAQNLRIYYLGTDGWVPIRELSRDEYYPASQAWAYDEPQDVWLNFVDTRLNVGPDAQFFSPDFAFRIDGSAVANNTMNVWVDDVSLTATTDLPGPVSPQMWQSRDIGNAGNAGSIGTNATTFSVTGSGQDIWNNGDAFRFLYQTRTGDGTLTARVASQTQADVWSKAGVMIRESADTGSRHAFLAITPGNGATFQYRATTLGPSANLAYGGPVAPYWVRLTRSSGTNFAGYYSANGATWTLLGATNLPAFNATALWGLAVTAHNNNTNSTATFDNFSLTQTPIIAAVSNQTLVAGQILALTNFILNPGTPPLALTWNLLNAPSGLTLGATSGGLNWRPTIAQSPTTNGIVFKVTDSRSASATQAFTATVWQPARPALSGPTYAQGQFSFNVGGSAGPDYSVWTSTNLSNWSLWQQFLAPAPPFLVSDPSATNAGPRFYRIQLGP